MRTLLRLYYSYGKYSLYKKKEKKRKEKEKEKENEEKKRTYVPRLMLEEIIRGREGYR